MTLSCSRTLRVPVAFAREICVPVRALRELPDDELRALLAHEAAHVVRRDAVWLMIAADCRGGRSTRGSRDPARGTTTRRIKVDVSGYSIRSHQAPGVPLRRDISP